MFVNHPALHISNPGTRTASHERTAAAARPASRITAQVAHLKITAALLATFCILVAFGACQGHAQAMEETLFNTSDTPAIVTDPDMAAVELGVKFRPSVSGQILGIRFYKGPQNTGTHTATLWSSTGTELATATLVNETASGWQEVRFASPVNVVADTAYVASCFAPVGRYSSDASYFVNDRTSGSLTAPSSASLGGNGVYHYGSASAFPSDTWSSTNYWVDTIFAADDGAVAPATIFSDNFDASIAWSTNGDVALYNAPPITERIPCDFARQVQ